MKVPDIEWQHENISFVDPLTNDVNIPTIGIEDLDNLLNGRSISSKNLSTFLHESSHNWCFQSIVGDTMAIVEAHTSIAEHTLFNIYYRLLREKSENSKNFHQKEKDEINLINQNKLKLIIIKRLLSPFLEGLALFIELDIIPAEPFILPPLLCCKRLYTRQGNESDTKFRDYLIKCREDKTRKLNLFLSSFGFKNGGHLRGYLFIKSIHNRLKKIYRNSLDDEAFIFFLKSFVLDCPKIGKAILDFEVNHRQFLKTFNRLLTDKFESLYTLTNDKIGHNIKRFISENQSKCDYLILGSYEKNLIDEVCNRIRADYSYFNLNVDGTELPESQKEKLSLFESLLGSAFTIRKYVRILSHKCKIDLKVKSNYVFVKADGINSYQFFVNNPAKYEEFDGYGSVDVYAHYFLDERFYVFSITDKTLLVAKQKNNDSVKVLEDPNNHFPSLYRKLNIKSIVNPGKFIFPDGFTNDITKCDDLTNHYLNKLYSINYNPLNSIGRDHFYLNTNFYKLKEDGFYNLLNDLSLVEKLVDMENGIAVDNDSIEKIRNKFLNAY